jgi:hypothetical protein
MRFISSRISPRVKTSYSTYCRAPATRSVRVGVQPVSAQNSSMQRCAAAGLVALVGGRQRDRDERRRPAGERVAALGDPAGDLLLVVLLVHGGRDHDEVVAAGSRVTGARDAAQVDLQSLAAHRLGEARGDLGGVPVRAGVHDERVGVIGSGGWFAHAFHPTSAAGARHPQPLRTWHADNHGRTTRAARVALTDDLPARR